MLKWLAWQLIKQTLLLKHSMILIQAAYEKGLAKYQADKKAYDAALEEYNTQKLTYDSKVAEKKQRADVANAKSKPITKYSWLFMKLLRRTMKLLWLSIPKTRQNMMLRRKLMM